MGVNAALYLRVSSTSKEGQQEDEKRQTTENQRLRLEEWLKSRKGIDSVTWFKDEQTGRNTKRPGFQEMIRGVEEGRFNMVVALRIDRLFRSMKDLAVYAQFFQEHSAGMVIVDQNIDIGPDWKDPTAQLLLNILGAIATFEVELTSRRTKDGLDRVRSENRKIGRPPFGFMQDPDRPGKFVPVSEKLELARRVINLRRRGAGYGEISGRLGLKISTVRAIIEHKSLYSDTGN